MGNLKIKIEYDLLVLLSSRHYCPYTCSLSTSSSSRNLWILILWWASRLYAFSAYPFPT